MDDSPLKRIDGRLPNEIRPFSLDWDPMGFALSSVLIKTGRTAVLCSISIQNCVPKWLEGQGRGWLSAEYRLLPGSTPVRQQRELIKLSGRTQEIQRLIGRSLRSIIDMEVLGEKTLLVDCDVVQADAGTRTASITGSWVALSKALQRLINQNKLVQNPLRGQVAALSVGLLDGQPLLDLNYSEDSKVDLDLNIVMTADGSLIEIQGSAEGEPFSRDQLDLLLDIAQPGFNQLHKAQISVLKK